MRSGANADLGLGDEYGAECLRRAAEMGKLMAEEGVMVIAAFVTPTESDQLMVQRILQPVGVEMVHVKCPLEVCRQRARTGLQHDEHDLELDASAGGPSPFEEPQEGVAVIQTDQLSVTEARDLAMSLFGNELPSATHFRPSPPVAESPKFAAGPPPKEASKQRNGTSVKADFEKALEAFEAEINQVVRTRLRVTRKGATVLPPTPSELPDVVLPNPPLISEAVLPPEPHPVEPSLVRINVQPEIVPTPATTALVLPREQAAQSDPAVISLTTRDQSEDPATTSVPRLHDSRSANLPERTMMHPQERDFIVFGICCLVLIVFAGYAIVQGNAPKVRRVVYEESEPQKALESAKVSAPVKADLASGVVEGQPQPGLKLQLNDLPKFGRDLSIAKQTAGAATQERSLREAAEAIMQPFWSATKWEEKLPFVHLPDRVSALMKDYYEVQNGNEPRGDSLELCNLRSLDGEEFLHLGYAAGGSRPLLEAALRRQTDGSFRLDWESFVGASGMGWQQFVTERPTNPVLFRVYAESSSYFNYEFNDDKKYASIRMESPDGVTIVYGYAEKGTPLADQVLSLFNDETKRATLTVSLAFPENAKSKDCVKLVDIIAERWFLKSSQVGN